MQKLTVFLLTGFVFLLVGCNKDTENLIDSQSKISSLHDVNYLSEVSISGLSNQELVGIHLMFADLYEKRNMLFEDWSNKSKYDLPPKYFSNEYIQKEIQMEFYDYVRMRSPLNEEFLETGFQTKKIQILIEKITSTPSGLWIIPVKVFTKKNKVGYDHERISFFSLNKFLAIANYEFGDIFDEILPYMYEEFLDKDWEKSFFNINGIYTGVNYDIRRKHLEFILNDVPKENKKTLFSNSTYEEKPILSKAGTYVRTAVIPYMTAFSLNPNSLYQLFSADCANFVSQCLFAGGFVHVGTSTTSGSHWWYNNKGTTATSDDEWSQTWSVANSLKNYISNYGTLITASDLYYGNSNVATGDPFFMKTSTSGSLYGHSMIVYSVSNGTTNYCAHTTNRFAYAMTNFTLSYWTGGSTQGYHITNINN
ncbi:MAG: amidase domain-containing protein [Candidatus Peribacteria bacterium]|jgi:hypothetical protein|nr:amidase domain-containing protein [Candidatus Peribacteria bacterium]